MEEQVFSFEYEGMTYYYNRVDKPDNIILEKDSNNKDKFIGRFKCPRCGGKGQSTWRPSMGICYMCRGKGYYTNILNVTKNIETAKRRIASKVAKRSKQEEEKRQELLNKNMEYTVKRYSDEFYIILDTLETSTYKTREYLKSKKAMWNPDWICWWIKAEIMNEEDFKDYKICKIPVNTVLNEYNRVDNDKVRLTVTNYLDWLDKKRGKVIV